MGDLVISSEVSIRAIESILRCDVLGNSMFRDPRCFNLVDTSRRRLVLLQQNGVRNSWLLSADSEGEENITGLELYEGVAYYSIASNFCKGKTSSVLTCGVMNGLKPRPMISVEFIFKGDLSMASRVMPADVRITFKEGCGFQLNESGDNSAAICSVLKLIDPFMSGIECKGRKMHMSTFRRGFADLPFIAEVGSVDPVFDRDARIPSIDIKYNIQSTFG